MTGSRKKILIYGYGNPGRQDDALGVMLANEVEKWSHEQGYPNISTDSNYQLNLEDAAVISNYDMVVFADASHKEIENYLFEPLLPSAEVEFTMHSVSPDFILHLCSQLFDHLPEAYLLHMKGYEWDFMKEPTDKAKNNLDKAFRFLSDYLVQKG